MSWFRSTPLGSVRWLAIDCETSGLDPKQDRLLSVGAIPVSNGRIDLGGRFAALIRQDTPSTAANILVHGIGGDAQTSGSPLAEVVRSLCAVAGDAFPVGFHAKFDETILRRHGFRAGRRWLDLAVLAPVLFSQHRHAKSLDEWLAVFGIAAEARHDALGDAFSTAQLLLVVLAEARRQGIESIEALHAVQRGRRWL